MTIQPEEKTKENSESAEAPSEKFAEADNTKLAQELAQMKDQWLRAVADGENLRKRAARDLQDARKYAVSEFAREMIGVAENLKRALESIPAEELENSPLVKTIYSGVDMTLKELLVVFERHGIKRIDPKDQLFDHNFHQAVAQVEDVNAKPGQIVQVIQAGYTIHDRLLLPAMVAVAKVPSEPPPHVDTMV